MKKKFIIGLLVTILVLALLAWALKDVSLANIIQTLGQLSFSQIIFLLVLNAGIFLLFSLRWWLILRSQGYRLPYLALSRYRLASFGVSYFTPGPQFGGEPLQVLLLRDRHQIAGRDATASVALDKLIELIANFSFLVFASGTVFLATPDLFGALDFNPLFSAMLLALPLVYLVLLWRGGKPISFLFFFKTEWQEKILEVESQLVGLVRKQPRLLIQTLAASALIWLALIFEYQLALGFLGLSLSFSSVLTIMLMARIAMLAPTPGALGTLEAGLVFAIALLGINPAYAVALALLIRGRDILFGSLGLLYAFSSGLLRKKTA